MPELWSAILGVASGLVAPIGRAARNQFRRLLGSKPRLVAGVWNGQATERLLGSRSDRIWLTSEARFDLKQDGDRITGKIIAQSSNKQSYVLTVEGRLESDQCLTMRVYSASHKEVNFGVLLLKLNSKGNKMSGNGLLSALDNPQVSLATLDLKKE